MTTYTPFYRLADVNGDGTGSSSGAVDGSSTPVTLKYTCPADTLAYVERCIVHIRDDAVLNADNYGGVDLSAGTGVGVEVQRAGTADDVDMLDGEKVKDVASWGRFCFDVADHTFGTGDNFVQVRWTFSKAGVPIKLVPGESINFIINDNLSTLVAHTFAVQGYTEPM